MDHRPLLVSDAPDEPVGTAVERGLHRGYPPAHQPDSATATLYWLQENQDSCATVCFDFRTDVCDWKTPCAAGDEIVSCLGETVTCVAAREAAYERAPIGLESCRRACLGLN
jgi:hypothetical protein